MPIWATRITTIGQLITVLAAIAAVVLLAVRGIIDGAAALGALMLITGAGALVPAIVNRVNTDQSQGPSPAPGEARRE